MSKNQQLSVILTIVYFNVFDSKGRLFTNLLYLKSKKRLFLLNILRIYFFVIFLFIFGQQAK